MFKINLILAFLIISTSFLSCSNSDDNSPVAVPPPEEVDGFLDLDGFDVYITHFDNSTGESSVKRFDGRTGEYIDDFVANGSGNLRNPQDVAFGPDGNFYVSGLGNSSILKFDGQTGQFIENFTSGLNLNQPTKFTFKGDVLYVSQWASNQNVIRYNANTGQFIDVFTSQSFTQGMGMVWDSDENLYIATFGARAILKYDSHGEFVNRFINSSLSGPVHLWINNDDFYVQDWSTGSIKRFNSQGEFVSNFITGFINTEGFSFSNSGNILIADWNTGAINFYESNGKLISNYIKEGVVKRPNSILIAPKK